MSGDINKTVVLWHADLHEESKVTSSEFSSLSVAVSIVVTDSVEQLGMFRLDAQGNFGSWIAERDPYTDEDHQERRYNVISDGY